MERTFKDLYKAVQHNCNVSDAHHADTYTMCVYLLKMREYFRWDKGYRFDTPLDTSAVGDWVSQREALWEQLANQSFQPLLIDGESFDPFETEPINQRLIPHGYIYSGGIGAKAVPHFFIADYQAERNDSGYHILISGKEYARDLTAPPGLSLDKTIFVRKESLKRMLWEKLNEWRWSRPHNAMATALSYYDFDGDLQNALEQMTEVETEVVILHEIGEQQARQYLPNNWRTILKQCNASHAELLVRAVKDHLADCIALLPALLLQQKFASLHFYVANMSAIRKAIFPSLLEGYQHWTAHGDTDQLEALIPSAQQHWQEKSQTLMETFDQFTNHRPELDDLIANYAC